MNESHEDQIRILIVDDEPLIRESLYEILRIDGYRCQMAATAEEAQDRLEKSSFDIVITDLKLPVASGLNLLEFVKKHSFDTEVIVITGYGSIESAVNAMKLGAFDYITKPINDTEIKLIIKRIIERKLLISENHSLKGMLSENSRDSFCGIVGASRKMQDVYRIVEAVASSNATILITGESGTGKGMTAKAIHNMDKKRSDKPFIEVSCGALSETLLESELFGHVKGSFTGAIKDKQGRFEYANDGTVFLDEIDSFSLELQVKLLRVLQDGVFERVGDNVTRKTNARIIVATNRDLLDLISKGDFREDLYYRINVISIPMPPLRDRKDDIPLISDFYLKKYSHENQKKLKGFSEDVIHLFQNYDWPGNIRELENAIEGSVIMAREDIIRLEDLSNVQKFISKKSATHNKVDIDQQEEPKSLKDAIEQPERDHIISVLRNCRWNRIQAAKELGINRTTLYNKMKKHNISEDVDRGVR